VTERKPPGVTWDHWMERLIRDAEARGEFDNLPGAGKPIPGKGRPDDPDWWLKDLLRREKLSVTPATLKLRAEVEQAVDRIRRASTEEAVRGIVNEINARIAEVNRTATDGPPSDLAPLDPDDVVRQWRARRAAPPPSE